MAIHVRSHWLEVFLDWPQEYVVLNLDSYVRLDIRHLINEEGDAVGREGCIVEVLQNKDCTYIDVLHLYAGFSHRLRPLLQGCLSKPSH